MIKFFSPEEEAQVIEAIRKAELNTSGEIRVHLESNCKGGTMRAARRTFRKLKMHRTQARNGVLIFLAPERKEFAIVGDEGIHEKVGDLFWEAEKKILEEYFRDQKFAEGICEVVEIIGEKLKDYFPYEADDVNELPDDISYGE